MIEFIGTCLVGVGVFLVVGALWSLWEWFLATLNADTEEVLMTIGAIALSVLVAYLVGEGVLEFVKLLRVLQ